MKQILPDKTLISVTRFPVARNAAHLQSGATVKHQISVRRYNAEILH